MHYELECKLQRLLIRLKPGGCTLSLREAFLKRMPGMSGPLARIGVWEDVNSSRLIAGKFSKV